MKHAAIPVETLVPAAAADGDDAVSRRRFLKWMAAAAALAGSGCKGPPQETIVPYVQMPELLASGQPVFYASTFVRRARAQGVLIECHLGRPTKIEGNPLHPASRGATDVFAQASVLQLWDPDRTQAVHERGALSSWAAFESWLAAQRAAWQRDRGAGLRVLTGGICSPTLAAQITALLERYPQAQWHAYDPLHVDAKYAATQSAFGMPLETLLRLDRAAAILALDADLFGDWPQAIACARDFADRRRALAVDSGGPRLYALESTPTLTGARADHRLARAPHLIEQFAWRLAARCGVPGVPADLPAASDERLASWEAALTKALLAARGRSLIVAGGSVSAATRVLVHALNATLGNVGVSVDYITPSDVSPADHEASITQLAQDMHDGRVRSLLIVDANPVYEAPADFDFAAALERVPYSLHLGLYRDETARRAVWHVPQTHACEQWSDARAHDGMASIMQPVIAPLYRGRSAHELLASCTGEASPDGLALVRGHWSARTGISDFDDFWQHALSHGVIEGTAYSPQTLTAPRVPQAPKFAEPGPSAVFVADPSVGAGEFANNPWLQELPRPFTKLTWDNAALLGPQTAAAYALRDGDIARIALAHTPQRSLEIPVIVLAAQGEGVVALPLGYGRSAAGSVGDGVGADVYRLRTRSAASAGIQLRIEATGARHALARTQRSLSTQGRDPVRLATLDAYRRDPHFASALPLQRTPGESLYPPWSYLQYKWGMAIDLNACIGCNACTIACQAENNIPSVGKAEVLRGREMHWIRVDNYELTQETGTRNAFQPVPCMHCEHAPCEEVCPVGATQHDSEGLNLQVYNRCVGTRYCSNNCPYKVRRFNFLQYADTATESLKAQRNPEVTVRQRGVMEKCTYCLQRITRARIAAENAGRRIRDGEVVTACQAVCPTRAIRFGDLNDPGSEVNRAKASPLDYALLAELNTRPRTTYSALVTDPDPDLA